MTIPAGYQDSLAAYNTAVAAYDKLVGRFSPAELVVNAEKVLVEAALKLAADVRITHEDAPQVDPSREMAASFIELADTHAAYITTSDLHTENFVDAFRFAEHMVNGGSYSGRESQLVFTQLRKLELHFSS